jgi:hypothetical protein
MINIINLDDFKILIMYSDIIIIISILILSIFSSVFFKGLFYLLIIIILSFFRNIIIKYQQINHDNKDEENIICKGSLLSFGSSSFTLFILTFTFFYIFTPMYYISNGENVNINYYLISFFIFYILLDVIMKVYYYKCFNSILNVELLTNFISGCGIGILISTIIYMSNIKNMLFINELINNNIICSRPTNQTFKCSLYKNGKLIG